MTIEQLPLHVQIILALASLILFTSFLLLAQSRIVATIRIFAMQGFLMALSVALIAFDSGNYHLLWSAGLTLGLKVWFIPYILLRQVRELNLTRSEDALHNPGVVLIGSGILVIFCYYVAAPVEQFMQSEMRHIISISLSVVLLGMLMLITRHKAITQVVGLMSMENGLFFAAVTSTHGMPMIVELGVAFDVLIATILFGIFFLHIRESIETLDVDQLNQLSEVDE